MWTENEQWQEEAEFDQARSAHENKRLHTDNERWREESEFDLAAIQIDADAIRHTQHAEILMLEDTQGETLLSSTMNKETQVDLSQLTSGQIP